VGRSRGQARASEERSDAPIDATRTDLAHDAWSSVLRMFLSDEHQRAFEQAANSIGLTPRLMKALLGLSTDEPKPMRMLAEEWFCDASYVTVLVDALEQRGLVTRETPSTDRRVKLIRLTAEGAELRRRCVENQTIPPSGLQSLPTGDLVQLRKLLAKAAEHYPRLG
jgi:MarR family transcriptional regulator, organic hydroperoxide resistance regulator